MADLERKYVSDENGNKVLYDNISSKIVKDGTGERDESISSVREFSSDPHVTQEHGQPKVSRSCTSSSGYSSLSSSVKKQARVNRNEKTLNQECRSQNDTEFSGSCDISTEISTEISSSCGAIETDVEEDYSTAVESSSSSSMVKMESKCSQSTNLESVHRDSKLLTPPPTNLSSDCEIFAPQGPQYQTNVYSISTGTVELGEKNNTNLVTPLIKVTPPTPPGSCASFITPTIIITPPTPPNMINNINQTMKIRDSETSDEVVGEVIASLKELMGEQGDKTCRASVETTPPTPNNSRVNLSDKYCHRVSSTTSDREYDDPRLRLSHKEGRFTIPCQIEEGEAAISAAAATCDASRPAVPQHEPKAKARSFHRVEFNNMISEVEAALNDGSHWRLHSRRTRRSVAAKKKLRKIKKVIKRSVCRAFKVGATYLEEQAKYGPFNFMYCTYHRSHTNL